MSFHVTSSVSLLLVVSGSACLIAYCINRPWTQLFEASGKQYSSPLTLLKLSNSRSIVTSSGKSQPNPIINVYYGIQMWSTCIKCWSDAADALALPMDVSCVSALWTFAKPIVAVASNYQATPTPFRIDFGQYFQVNFHMIHYRNRFLCIDGIRFHNVRLGSNSLLIWREYIELFSWPLVRIIVHWDPWFGKSTDCDKKTGS